MRGSGQSAMLKAVMAAVKRVAAEEVMPRYLKATLQTKGDGTSFTEADMAAQKALIRRLQAILNLPVIGEEMGEQEQRAAWEQGGAGVWCIDPIDGTSNFVRGLPYFAVSVALIRAGRAVLGVVYDPVGKEMFGAETGRGAFLNGEKLARTNVVKRLSEAMANIDMKRLNAELVGRLATEPPYSSLRSFGASTLDWCYTAAGRYDVYLHGGQKLWDYAAGALILQEAGGSACTLEHDDFRQGNVWQRSVIASLDASLFNEWKSWVRARQ